MTLCPLHRHMHDINDVNDDDKLKIHMSCGHCQMTSKCCADRRRCLWFVWKASVPIWFRNCDTLEFTQLTPIVDNYCLLVKLQIQKPGLSDMLKPCKSLVVKQQTLNFLAVIVLFWDLRIIRSVIQCDIFIEQRVQMLHTDARFAVLQNPVTVHLKHISIFNHFKDIRIPHLTKLLQFCP